VPGWRDAIVGFLVLVSIGTARGEEVCSGPTAWICEEHQMLNAVPPPSQKFDSNAVPRELLNVAPSGTERPLLGNPQTGTSPNEALEINPTPTETRPYRVDKATLEKQPCLSQREVRGGWPKYRIIKGRQCWYASRPADYGSLSPGNAGSGAAEQSQRLGAGECRDQAAKLDAAEKRAFLRECMSSRK
jgi:hypothetical protein